MALPEPLDPKAPPPCDKHCDLVLTGGVTSGVVYPWAILELARVYRFKSIGGTSVGAMAAALTAAAEYTRRNGSPAGFEVLRQLPLKLAEDRRGKTTLLSLFQPAVGTERLFSIFLRMLNQTERLGFVGWLARLAGAVAWAFKWHVLGGVIAAWLGLEILGLVFGPPGAIGALLAYGLGAVVATVAALYRDVVRGLVPNGFGICKGSAVGTDRDAPEALMDWLHRGIQTASGRSFDEKPLTFRDLLEKPALAPKGEAPKGTAPQDAAAKTGVPQPWYPIDLQMVTTNVTLGRPYAMPRGDKSSPLFFKAGELRPYLPEPVIAHMVSKSKPYAPNKPADPPAPDDAADYLELPIEDLPVVAAARLSLSFPFLFAAVPLWAIDYSPRTTERKLRRCWFSDGGICSNFPIHFFDALIPNRPTFGIWLGARSRHHQEDEPVWLSRYHDQGRSDSWASFDDNPAASASRLSGFAGAMLDSARNWSDNTLMRMPGVRDRVVRIRLREGEGSLNLKLSGEQIKALAAEYGTEAGRQLVEKFDGPAKSSSLPAPERAPERYPSAWDEHRWVRFNTLAPALAECLKNFTAAAEGAPYSTKLSSLIDGAYLERPLWGTRADEAILSAAQADSLARLLKSLTTLEAEFKNATVQQPYSSMPAPALRLRPPM